MAQSGVRGSRRGHPLLFEPDEGQWREGSGESGIADEAGAEERRPLQESAGTDEFSTDVIDGHPVLWNEGNRVE